MKTSRLLIAASVAALISFPVFAGDARMPGKTAAVWAGLDANGDGQVSKQEWDDYYQKRFEKMDVNHDGIITKEEWIGGSAKSKHRKHAEDSNAAATPEPAAVPAP